jgi:hypothetical protein
MTIRFICFLAFNALALTACVTPGIPTDAPLTAWARGYGYQPYTLNGQHMYCDSGTSNGANCITEDAMASLKNNQMEPPFSMRGWLSTLGPTVIGGNAATSDTGR